MAKGKVPPQLRAHQFTKGSGKAKKAGAKGGRMSPSTASSATPASKKRATKGKGGKSK